jgi:hypothetical protein
MEIKYVKLRNGRVISKRHLENNNIRQAGQQGQQQDP